MGKPVMYSEQCNASCDEDCKSSAGWRRFPLALLLVWMVVALRVKRLKMATIAPLAMLVIGMILTRTGGSTDE